MPVATTTEAGRAALERKNVSISTGAEKVLNDAKRARDELNGVPLETIPEPPKVAPVKPQATFTIHALMDDFPFEVSFSGSAEQLSATVQKLRDLGAVPPTQAARAAVQEERERSAPVCNCDTCDRFGQPMKESTKVPGTHFCPGKIGTKAGQPVYCKSKG